MVEGESSLTAHSVFANDLVHRVMSGGTSMPEMHERIETLRNMVEAMKKQPAAHEMTYPHAKPAHFGAPKGCDLPPIAKTLELLKLSRANPELGIAWVFELFEMEHFPETCLALYMAEEYNAAQFITVNVGLHLLFSGYSCFHQEREQEYLDLAHICAVNVETALLSLPLHLPANDDVIVALSFGVRFSQRCLPVFHTRLTPGAGLLCCRTRQARVSLGTGVEGIRVVPVPGISPNWNFRIRLCWKRCA